jgi:hypothetical protein
MRVIEDQYELPCFGQLGQFLAERVPIVADEADVPLGLREPARKLEREATLAATRRRRDHEDPPAGSHRIGELRLALLIAHIGATMIDQCASRRILEEGPVVGLRIDEALPLWLPREAIPQLRGELRSSRPRTKGF